MEKDSRKITWTENYEKKVLTRKISTTWKLSDIIKTLDRNELDSICKAYSIKGFSKLKKNELYNRIVTVVPEKVKRLFKYIDIYTYKLLKEACDNNGVIKDIVAPAEHAYYFQSRCFLFAGLNRNKNILYIPKDICEEFKEIDNEELAVKASRNTELINLLHGYLHYYGVMELYHIYSYLFELNGVIYDHTDIGAIQSAEDLYGRIRFDGTYLYNSNVSDYERLLKIHINNQNIFYFNFNKTQILKVDTADYVEMTDELDKLFDYVESSFILTECERKKLAYEVVLRINNSDNPFAALDYLQEYFEQPSSRFVDDLLPYYAEAYNSIRQWELKGYAPKSLNLKMIRFKDKPEIKVGRNDLCPCGSGKKYKKCCGRL